MDSLSRLEGKAAKVLGKSNQTEFIHIYKISSENLGGGGARTSTSRLSRSSEKDEDTSSNSSRCSVSDETSSGPTERGLVMKMDDKEFSPTKILSTKPRRQMLVLSDGVESNGQILRMSEDYNSDIFCTLPDDNGLHDNYRSPPTTMKSKETTLIDLNAYYSSSPAILSSPRRV